MVLSVLPATLLTLVLAGCGDAGSSDDGTAGAGGPGGASSESTAEPAEPSATPSTTPADLDCPAELARSAGIVDPAEATPTFPRLEAAVVCSYFSGRSPDGGWERQVGPVEVPEDDLAGLGEALGGLRPAPADQMCTMDIGARVLLLAATADGTVGVVTEAYGCGAVLLTDDPATTAPGSTDAGLAVAGSLAPGADLLAQLEPLLR